MATLLLNVKAKNVLQTAATLNAVLDFSGALGNGQISKSFAFTANQTRTITPTQWSDLSVVVADSISSQQAKITSTLFNGSARGSYPNATAIYLLKPDQFGYNYGAGIKFYNTAVVGGKWGLHFTHGYNAAVMAYVTNITEDASGERKTANFIGRVLLSYGGNVVTGDMVSQSYYASETQVLSANFTPSVAGTSGTATVELYYYPLSYNLLIGSVSVPFYVDT